MSGNVTISDQRSYIKIKTLCCKNPTEIHSSLSEVCGEFTVSRNKVPRWINGYRRGYVSTDKDPIPGREHQQMKEVRSF